MTKMYLNPRHLEMWLYQNDASTMECLDGCLLDNLLIETKRGYAAVYEHPINSCSSDYYIEFQAGAADDVFNNWYAFYEEYQKATA